MRSSKPIVETNASRPAVFVAVFLFGIFAACYSPPAVLNARHVPDQIYTRQAGFEICIRFLTPEDLLDRDRWLNSGLRQEIAFEQKYIAARRAPDLTALEVAVLNYGASPARVDFHAFRITESGGRTFTPITPRQFRERFAGRASGSLAYYEFAFQQKESYFFAQPIPDWFNPFAASESTLAPAEEFALHRRQDALTEELRAMRATVAPGDETRGIVLFPMLAENTAYRLEYAPPETVTNAAVSAREFVFAPVDFRYDVIALRRDAKPNPAEEKTRTDSETKAQAERARLRDAQYRDARELQRMHAQLRRHAELRAQPEQ